MEVGYRFFNAGERAGSAIKAWVCHAVLEREKQGAANKATYNHHPKPRCHPRHIMNCYKRLIICNILIFVFINISI